MSPSHENRKNCIGLDFRLCCHLHMKIGKIVLGLTLGYVVTFTGKICIGLDFRLCCHLHMKIGKIVLGLRLQAMLSPSHENRKNCIGHDFRLCCDLHMKIGKIVLGLTLGYVVTFI